MPSVAKKLIFSFIASLIVLFSLAPSLQVIAQKGGGTSGQGAGPTGITNNPTVLAAQTSAAAPWYAPNFFDWYDKVYNENTSPGNEIFGERYTAAQVQWVFFSVLSSALNIPYTILGIFGIDVASPTPTTCALGVIHGSLDIGTCFQSVGNFIAAFGNRLGANAPVEPSLAANQNLWSDVFSTNRQLSFIGYTAGIIQKFNPVTDVHAQTTGGFGFSRLLVISDLWSVTRNAAYAILIVAVIAIAFMIMFRVKISPQASITIQSAIPRIVITLILITFSLAIAGLMIDLMYVVIGFIATLLPSLSGYSGNATEAYNFLVGRIKDGFLGLFFDFAWYLLCYLATSFVITLSALLTLNLTSIIFGVVMFLFTIVLFFILIINWFKVLFMLVKTTALIYVAVIVAPLQLMMGVFPGPLGAGAFSGWLKGLVSKLAVFPVAGLLLFFSFKFLGASFMLSIQGVTNAYSASLSSGLRTACAAGVEGSTCNYWLGSNFTSASFWGPPLLGDAGAITGLVFLLISVGAILMIPKVADMVEGFLSGKPIGLGSAIGESLEAGYGLSGAKDYVGMGQKALREEQLRSLVANSKNPDEANLVRRIIGALENAPVVGKTVTNARANIEKGMNRHS